MEAFKDMSEVLTPSVYDKYYEFTDLQLWFDSYHQLNQTYDNIINLVSNDLIKNGRPDLLGECGDAIYTAKADYLHKCFDREI